MTLSQKDKVHDLKGWFWIWVGLLDLSFWLVCILPSFHSNKVHDWKFFKIFAQFTWACPQMNSQQQQKTKAKQNNKSKSKSKSKSNATKYKYNQWLSIPDKTSVYTTFVHSQSWIRIHRKYNLYSIWRSAARKSNIKLTMRENRNMKINANIINRLSLSLIYSHSNSQMNRKLATTELYGKSLDRKSVV